MRGALVAAMLVVASIGFDYVPAHARDLNHPMTAPSVERTSAIRLPNESNASVSRIVFSPDGRYLAVLVDNASRRVSDIIVWDLKLDQEQSRIENLPIYAFPYIKISWSPNGRYISLGMGGQGWPMKLWNPLTGAVEKELDVKSALPSVSSRDGSKLLVNTTPIVYLNPIEGSYRVYDTRSWNFRDYSADGLMVQTLAWTSDQKVILAGVWPKWSVGRSIDGVTPQMSDVLVRRVDPDGIENSRTVIVGHGIAMAGRPDVILAGPVSCATSTTDSSGDMLALGSGHINVLNTKTLSTVFFYAPSESDSIREALPDGALGANVAFSHDGKFLFLGGQGTEKSLIIEALTGAEVGTFSSGRRGIAVSPDGKTLAQGNGNSVYLLTLKNSE